MTVKEIVKVVIKKIPIAFTKNQKYDRDTKEVIQKICRADSNCIDIGCFKGEILDIFLQYAPNGHHNAFEPIPQMYNALIERYTQKNVNIHNLALSDRSGVSTFNYVVSNPSYSGLVKRKYDKKNEVDEQITVKTAPLDEVLPNNYKVTLMKIDVEGGEYQVLKGAEQLIKREKPTIVFEHGMAAASFYGTKPDDLYSFLKDCGMVVSTMRRWLDGESALSLADFERCYHDETEYYYIAYAA